MSRIQDALQKTRSASKKMSARDARLKRVRPSKTTPETGVEALDFDKLASAEIDEALLTENKIVAAQPDATARAIYKILRTRIIHRMRASNWNVLGITGSGPGEGKTLTAINLAYSLSHDLNNRVILVDLDLRRPSIHKVLGLEPKLDLDSQIYGGATLEQTLLRPGGGRLAVLCNSIAYRDSSEILSSPAMVNLVEELRAVGPNTITIFDLPPVLAGDDVIAFSPLIDAILLVVAEGIGRRENFLGMLELLKDTEIIGTVLNRSRDKSSSMDYYGYY